MKKRWISMWGQKSRKTSCVWKNIYIFGILVNVLVKMANIRKYYGLFSNYLWWNYISDKNYSKKSVPIKTIITKSITIKTVTTKHVSIKTIISKSIRKNFGEKKVIWK